MASTFCLFGLAPCFTMSEWRDLALIISAYIALPGVLIAAFKAHYELKKLRQERSRERRSRIHEKQLEALMRLFATLKKIQDYSQLTTKSVILEGEKIEEYPKLLGESVVKAANEFTQTRLLLPIEVASLVEEFFEKAVDSQIRMGVFERLVGVQGEVRKQYWEQAANIAHSEMPSLLAKIEASARSIIHEEDANRKGFGQSNE